MRVDIRKLDELMNLVGELVIQRGAIGDLIARLAQSGDRARIHGEFAKVHKSLDRKLRELQSAVLEVRMVPLRQVFEKVSRVVRRLRRELGKQVELEIRGADTELDKLIVEALVDPLMHVVRNSLDHAIEAPDERRAVGKDESGRIAIQAFQRGSHVVIEVRDDGRGIDAPTLRRRAEQLGLVERGAGSREKETLDLIFAPGISTRDEVSETSGRGVGMDIVRSNLAALGGVVDVQSTPGHGTAIAMTLPITLAIIQSLIVGVRDRRFAIPLNAVLETLVIDPAVVQLSEGRSLLNLRGEPLLLRRLDHEFALDSGTPAPRPCVIVIGVGDAARGARGRPARGSAGHRDQADPGTDPEHARVLGRDRPGRSGSRARARRLRARRRRGAAAGGGMSSRSPHVGRFGGWDQLARAAAQRREAPAPAERVRQLLVLARRRRSLRRGRGERARDRARAADHADPARAAEVRGVISLRGEIIQVIDLRLRLGLAATATAPRHAHRRRADRRRPGRRRARGRRCARCCACPRARSGPPRPATRSAWWPLCRQRQRIRVADRPRSVAGARRAMG